MMKNKSLFTAGLLLMLGMTSCSTHYRLAGIERSRLLIDSHYDWPSPLEVTAFIAPHQQKVDSMIKPVVGRAACFLPADRPESPLSNLLSDVLMWAAPSYGEQPDFAVYNIGGIRAAIAAGDVTIGDILDVAPFENKICFLTLTGEKVMQLFREIGLQGGEGVSKGVCLMLASDLTLTNATLNGKPIDPQHSYRIVTLDYVAQGNDHMDAFKSGTDLNAPKDEHNNVRYIIMDYFRDRASKGEAVDARVEGRVVVPGKQ